MFHSKSGETLTWLHMGCCMWATASTCSGVPTLLAPKPCCPSSCQKTRCEDCSTLILRLAAVGTPYGSLHEEDCCGQTTAEALTGWLCRSELPPMSTGPCATTSRQDASWRTPCLGPANAIRSKAPGDVPWPIPDSWWALVCEVGTRGSPEGCSRPLSPSKPQCEATKSDCLPALTHVSVLSISGPGVLD
jgi:hypothetical protein